MFTLYKLPFIAGWSNGSRLIGDLPRRQGQKCITYTFYKSGYGREVLKDKIKDSLKMVDNS